MERNFQSPMPKQPSRIFVNSMSEIRYWKLEWWEKILWRIQENPQHTFFFLTKFPMSYPLGVPSNCYLGVTITTEKEIELRTPPVLQAEHSFASVEPIQEPIDSHLLCGRGLEWVILGAETGNRKEKVIPPPEWIEPFLSLPIPLYMKQNLPWSGPWRKEFPV